MFHFHWKYFTNETDKYKEILSNVSGAITLLGEPIKQRGFKLGAPENFLTSDEAQFQVNVKGPNDTGKFVIIR